MIKKFLQTAIIYSAVSGQTALAQEVKNCDLNKVLSLETVGLTLQENSYSKELEVRGNIQVTNNSKLAISGFAVSYEIYTTGRAIPWKSDDYRFYTIEGGIEPTETIEKTIRVEVSKRAKEPIEYRFNLVDVRDDKRRSLTKQNINLIGWPKEVTSYPCD